MIFKTFLIISVIIVSIYSESVENISNESVNCDTFFVEAEESLLEQFIQRKGLQQEYEERNDSFDSCLKFLDKFILLVDEYRKEEGKQADYILQKRAYKMRPNGFGKLSTKIGSSFKDQD
jgi:hypothetical protein